MINDIKKVIEDIKENMLIKEDLKVEENLSKIARGIKPIEDFKK
jgi:hypothetical protein